MIDENKLREDFERLRDADRKRAPGFAETCTRARAHHSVRSNPRLRPVVMAVAAAVLIAAVWMERTGSFARSGASPAIATWRAPTDVLLDTPGRDLLGAMPALGASVLDTMIPTTSNKGT